MGDKEYSNLVTESKLDSKTVRKVAVKSTPLKWTGGLKQTLIQPLAKKNERWIEGDNEENQKLKYASISFHPLLLMFPGSKMLALPDNLFLVPGLKLLKLPGISDFLLGIRRHKQVQSAMVIGTFI